MDIHACARGWNRPESRSPARQGREASILSSSADLRDRRYCSRARTRELMTLRNGVRGPWRDGREAFCVNLGAIRIAMVREAGALDQRQGPLLPIVAGRALLAPFAFAMVIIRSLI